MAQGKHAQTSETDKVTCFFVLGGPGCGKGTNCARLVQEFGFIHLSAGDLLRAERDSGSPDGDLINSIILKGDIVPVKITVALIKKAIIKHGGVTKKFLVDGFPRNEENLNGWHEVMGDFADAKFVLFLDCEEQAMIDRINKRASESAEARNDDNLEVLKKRFRTFKEQSIPIVELFEKLGKVKRVDANQDPEAVYADVKAAFTGHAEPTKPANTPKKKDNIIKLTTVPPVPPMKTDAPVDQEEQKVERDDKEAGSSTVVYATAAIAAAAAVAAGYFYYSRQAKD